MTRGPALPGEDFVANLPDSIAPPVDLANGSSQIIITVEPDIDGTDPTGEGAFSLRPWAASIPRNAASNDYRQLSAGPNQDVWGSVTFVSIP